MLFASVFSLLIYHLNKLSISIEYFHELNAKTKKHIHTDNLTFHIIVDNKTKGRISKRVFQENKAHQIFRKSNISYPLIRTYLYISGRKKCSLFGKFGVLCFLETLVFRFALSLITDVLSIDKLILPTQNTVKTGKYFKLKDNRKFWNLIAIL